MQQKGKSFKGDFEATQGGKGNSQERGWGSYKTWIENQVRLKAQL